jgi:integrase
MNAQPRRIPTYSLHKHSGLARVRISGRDVYLGKFGTPESHAEYERVIGEWLASGGSSHGITSHKRSRVDESLTITEVIAAHWKQRLVSGVGQATLQRSDRPAFRHLRKTYGHTLAIDFRARSLRAYQRAMVVDEGLSRQYVNSKLSPAVKRLFKWAVREELLPVESYQRLALVPGLRLGEFEAREAPPVRAVPDERIEATLPHLPQIVADMVRVQRLTGMRPAEVCGMRFSEIDTSGACWFYAPARHKNAHRGLSRTVPLGPKAQAILMKYRRRDPKDAVFSPRESEAQRHKELRRARQTPMTPSQLARDAERQRNTARRGRRPGEAYTAVSYAQVIRRSCETAGVERWTPNQIRHTAATELRKKQGLDAAWALMGHEKPDTTLIYAEQRLDRAAKIAMETG